MNDARHCVVNAVNSLLMGIRDTPHSGRTTRNGACYLSP